MLIFSYLGYNLLFSKKGMVLPPVSGIVEGIEDTTVDFVEDDCNGCESGGIFSTPLIFSPGCRIFAELFEWKVVVLG